MQDVGNADNGVRVLANIVISFLVLLFPQPEKWPSRL